MPQMFKAISMESAEPVKRTLSTAVTPEIPADSQWFTFLRCHDELSLELVYVNEEDRAYIHKNYCHQPEWDFRIGEGISARISELFKKDIRKISLAYSMMLSLPGTPVLYYGDEFGKGNDDAYYREQIKLTGKDDTRFLVRGKVNWEEVEHKLNEPNSFESQVFRALSNLVNTRQKFKAFGRGEIKWIEHPNESLLIYQRSFNNENIMVMQNLSSEDIICNKEGSVGDHDLLGQEIVYKNNTLVVPAYSFYWIQL
jgi:maltose alpha-D-glucosyltransferase/alpha-amylase